MTTKDFKEFILDFGYGIARASNGRIRVAHNELENSKDREIGAAHFLKLDEKRLGRDLELYGFMGEIEGQKGVMIRLLEELCLPIKNCKSLDNSLRGAVGIGKLRLIEVGMTVFSKGKEYRDWVKLVSDLLCD